MKSWLHTVGSSGQEVRRLQSALGIQPDGIFGSATDAALRDFQSLNSLVVDGVSGPSTRRELGIDIYPGIDVSNWQGDIDWDSVASTSLARFCWVKVSEGNTHEHPRREKNISECIRVGIPVGGYHFARPDLHDDPFDEVKNFVKNCPITSGGLRPVLDFEKAGSHSPSSIRKWVLTFLEEFERRSGVEPMIYTGGNMTKYHLMGDTTGIDNYTLWHAYYPRDTNLTKGIKGDRLGGWSEWRVWQWTASGTVTGISGKVDRNWLVGGKPGFDEVLVK